MYVLVSDVDNRGRYACLEIEGMWEISLPRSRFCCKPKTAPSKIKSLKINIEKVNKHCPELIQLELFSFGLGLELLRNARQTLH